MGLKPLYEPPAGFGLTPPVAPTRCDGPSWSLDCKCRGVRRSIYIEAAALERKPLRFETALRPALVDLSDPWRVTGDVEAAGAAELLDRQGVRSIRVRGRIRASVDHVCDRCLKALQQDFDSKFDLYFYPMTMIEDGGEAAISMDETEVGFYEGDGVGLADVVREQLLLWLPARSLCSPDCKGICSVCGKDRNEANCECSESFADPRWDALRHLGYKH